MEKKSKQKQNRQHLQLQQLTQRVDRLLRAPKRRERGAAAFPVAGQGPFEVPILRQRPGVHVIKHREFAQDISSTGAAFALAVNQYLNPGNELLFPWLSRVALQFERYRFRRCTFWYRSASGTAVGSTNTALGVVVLAVDYDALDLAFSNKQQMESYDGAVSTVPSASVRFDLDCKLAHQTGRNLYVHSSAAPPSGADVRLYHVGNFALATSGQQAAAVLGELWVDYEIELYTPKVPLGNEDLPAFQALTDPVSTTTWLASPEINPNSTLEVVLNGPANRVTIMKTGRFRCVITCNCASFTANLGPLSVSGCILENIGWTTPTAGVTSCSVWCDVVVTSTLGGEFTMGMPTLSGATSTRFTIMQIPDHLH